MLAALQQLGIKGAGPLLKGSVRRRGRHAAWLSHPALPPLATLALGSLLATVCYNMMLPPSLDMPLEDSADGAGWGTAEESALPTPKRLRKHSLGNGNEDSLESASIMLADRDERAATQTLSNLPLAPKTTILSGPAKVSPEQKPIMKFGADRGGCSFEIKLDDSRWIQANSPLRFKQPLADGNHTFLVRAIDGKGRKDKNPAALHWTVDTQAPTLHMSHMPERLTHKTAARFEVEASEARCKFPFQLEYRRLPQQDWISADPTQRGGGGVGHTEGAVAELLDPRRIRLTVPGVLEGQHRLYIMAVDEAGNESGQEEFVWSVDLTPPKTVIKQAPKRFTKSKVAVFAVGAKGVEDGWTYQYQLNDDSGWTQGPTGTVLDEYEGAYQLTLKDLMEGPQRLSVRAVDAAGNIDLTGVTYQWTIHDQPADTIILTGPKELSNLHTAAFTIASSETWFSYAYRLDGEPVQRPEGLKLVSAPAAFNITDIGEGNHTIMVRATDVTGGEDPTPAVYRWYVDLTPPRARLIHQPPKVSLDTNAIFGIEADEPYVLQYKLDHGMWQNSDGSIIRSTDGAFAAYDLKPHSGPIRFKMSGLTEGKHQLHLNITDAVGNTNSIDPIVWVVDFGAPSTTVEKTPAQQTKSKKAMFVVSASEPDCVIQYRIDRKSWINPGKEPQIVKAHPIAGRGDKSAVTMEVWAGVGFHVIEFRAKDAAGNTDSNPTAFEWVTF
eukprot:jgi/Tetstr1/443050/TSEL_031109.t1